MTYEEYLDIIRPLVIRFGKPGGGDDALIADFEILKIFNTEDVQAAVQAVLVEHRFHTYPTLAEIMDCLQDVLILKPEAQEPECSKDICMGCLGTGIFFSPITELARFCDCEAGQRKRELFLVYRKTGDWVRAKRAAAEIETKPQNAPVVYRPKVAPSGQIIGYEYTEKIHLALCEKIKKRRLK